MSHRSIRINGATTSVNLEPAFWQELDKRAEARGIGWQEYVRSLLDEYGEVDNRASALKQGLFAQVKAENTYLQGRTERWNINSHYHKRVIQTVGHRILVGRDAANDIALDDPKVSRKHCMLAFDDTFWWVIDLQSKNGIKVNDKQALSHKLNPGDVLSLGDALIALA